MKIKKAVYMVLGFVGLALGAVGAVVPLLPAFPFLLLAAMVSLLTCMVLIMPLNRARQRVLRNFITGLSERNFTEKIWKALLKAEE